MGDELIDDDPSITKLKRRFDDHVVFTREEINTVKKVLNSNTGAVSLLTTRFDSHDVKETDFREMVFNMIRGWSETTSELTTAMHANTALIEKVVERLDKYEIKMKPAENAITWYGVTKSISGWFLAVGGGVVLVKNYGVEFLKWLTQ